MASNHLWYKCTKTTTEQKNLEKMFSFQQLVCWKATILVEVSCFYRPDSGIAFELELETTSLSPLTKYGWACTQSSFLFLPSEQGAWGAVKDLQSSLGAEKAEDNCTEDAHGHSSIWSMWYSVSRVMRHGLVFFCLLFTTGRNNLCSMHLLFVFSLAFHGGTHHNLYQVLTGNSCPL